MFNRFRRGKQSVLHSWRVFGATLLLLFAAIFAVVFGVSSNLYRRETENTNRYMIEHVKMLLDNILEDAQRASNVIWLDNEMVELFKMGDKPTDADYAYFRQVTNKITQTQAANDLIESIFIVDARKDRIFARSGITDMQTYYNANFSGSEGGFEGFAKIFDSAASEMYCTIRNGSGGVPGSVAYVRRFGYSGKAGLAQSVVVTINEESLIKQMRSVKNIGNGCEVYAINKDGVLMASTGGEIYKDIDIMALDDKDGQEKVRAGGERYVVGYKKSSIGGWTYLVAHTRSKYIMNTMFFQMVMSMGFVLIVLVAAFAIYRFFKKNYSSLFELLRILGKQQEVENNCEKNEFDIIENTISNMLHQNKSMDKLIYNQDKILKNRLIEQLLAGTYTNDISTLDSELRRYGIELKGDMFVVLSLFWTEGNDTYSYEQMIFIVTNILEEMLAAHNRGYFVEYEGAMSGIVNVFPDRCENYRTDIEKAVNDARNFIRDNFKFDFTVACSSLFEGIDNAGGGYREAVAAMRYKSSAGADETIFFDNINNESGARYHYPFVEENKLHNLIASGDADGAKKIIDAIFAQNYLNNEFNHEIAKYLLFNISATVFRTVNESADEIGEEFIDYNLYSRIMECDSIYDGKERLFEYISDVCVHMHDSRGAREQWIRNDVIPYIEQNYSDCNLSVALIADKFDLHPVYISRVFKERMGIGLFEYISKYRIDRSKEILENSTYNLERVAEMVGYTNSRTFARMFKQTEGVTPGQYRNMHSK